MGDLTLRMNKLLSKLLFQKMILKITSQSNMFTCQSSYHQSGLQTEPDMSDQYSRTVGVQCILLVANAEIPSVMHAGICTQTTAYTHTHTHTNTFIQKRGNPEPSCLGLHTWPVEKEERGAAQRKVAPSKCAHWRVKRSREGPSGLGEVLAKLQV